LRGLIREGLKGGDKEKRAGFEGPKKSPSLDLKEGL
jgi:hypothetical protein